MRIAQVQIMNRYILFALLLSSLHAESAPTETYHEDWVVTYSPNISTAITSIIAGSAYFSIDYAPQTKCKPYINITIRTPAKLARKLKNRPVNYQLNINNSDTMWYLSGSKTLIKKDVDLVIFNFDGEENTDIVNALMVGNSLTITNPATGESQTASLRGSYDAITNALSDCNTNYTNQ